MTAPAGPRQRARGAAPDQLLLGLAVTRPTEALAAAEAALGDRPGPFEASVAWQAIGIVLRSRGELTDALAAMRRALRLAMASGRPDRETDVRATLGPTLVWAGRTREGLACLDSAVARARGGSAGRVLMRRALAYYALGQYEAALADLTRGVPMLRRAGDPLWEARSLNLRADVYLALGRTAKAAADHIAAERMLPADDLEYAIARHNLGMVAAASGDVPRALAYFDDARARFAAVGALRPDHVLDRCSVLLTAGLAREAYAEADAAAGRLDPAGGHGTKLAELLLTAAIAALADGLPAEARRQAQAARRLFAAQGRDWWTARAEFVALRARYAAAERSAKLLTQTQDIAARLDALGAEDAAHAYLLAGRLAAERGQAELAEAHLTRAARDRTAGPPLARAEAWLAQALLAEAHLAQGGGDERRITVACTRGLEALDEHRLTLGASEQRAEKGWRGAELSAIVARQALRRGDARRLLAASERRRAAALAPPPRRPQEDAELVRELSALRFVSHRLESVRAAGGATATLEGSRRRLEHAVRARTRASLGGGAEGPDAFRVEDLGARLGPARLVELVEVDGALHAVVVVGSGPRGGVTVRQYEVGAVAEAEREVEVARFALRRLAADPPAGRRSAGLSATLDGAGKLLEEALLGPVAGDLGEGPVVVVPPGRLPAVPWGLLPSLAGRAVAVAPSAATWLRARDAVPPAAGKRRVVLVHGRGVGEAEVPALAAGYTAAAALSRLASSPVVLGGGTATAERVLAALDGAWVAHVCAQASLRADNPLFSSLALDDGPLTVHDLERMRRAPYRLVLSRSDAGPAAEDGADELLGLAATLVGLGGAGLLASVVPVDAAAAAPLLAAVHARLRAGDPLAEALRVTRAAGADDPAVAACFVALGY